MSTRRKVYWMELDGSVRSEIPIDADLSPSMAVSSDRIAAAWTVGGEAWLLVADREGKEIARVVELMPPRFQLTGLASTEASWWVGFGREGGGIDEGGWVVDVDASTIGPPSRWLTPPDVSIATESTFVSDGVDDRPLSGTSDGIEYAYRWPRGADRAEK